MKKRLENLTALKAEAETERLEKLTKFKPLSLSNFVGSSAGSMCMRAIICMA